jgi:hypothetical protein
MFSMRRLGNSAGVLRGVSAMSQTKAKKRIAVLHRTFCDVLGERGSRGVGVGKLQLSQQA